MKFIVKLISCLTVVGFVGCGSDLPPLAPLKGSVSLNGEPFANGSLMFSPSSGGRPSVAKTNDKGEFEALYSMEYQGQFSASIPSCLKLVGPMNLFLKRMR
jgi:hypothetical protein